MWTTTVDLVFLFPTLVLGPHRQRSPSSVLKTEITARLDLWHRGDLTELAQRAVAMRMASPKSTRKQGRGQ